MSYIAGCAPEAERGEGGEAVHGVLDEAVASIGLILASQATLHLREKEPVSCLRGKEGGTRGLTSLRGRARESVQLSRQVRGAEVRK